jgi:hypothetical protein
MELRSHASYIHAASHKTMRKKVKTMTRYKPFNRIGAFLDVMGSAIAAANAVERHVTPEARHLRKLGIDPKQFGQIRLN